MPATLNEPPQILHVIDRLDGYGAARTLHMIAAAQAAAGEKVAVACLLAHSGMVSSLEAHGVRVDAVGHKRDMDAVAWGRLAWHVRSAEADVVHVWKLAPAAAAMLGPRSHSAVIATLGDPRGLGRWPRRATAFAARRLARVIVADESAKAALIGRGGDAGRVVVIPAGVSPPPSNGTKATFLASLGFSEETRVIAVAGRLVRSKRIDDAIWTYELVRVVHPEARLVIFGDGPDRVRLERFAAQVSEPRCVAFVGYRDDFRPALAHVDVYWQLDVPAATPRALLEAMSAGIPAVATDVAPHRAVIRGDESGVLVPVAGRAALTRITDRLLSSATFARTVGAAGASLVRQERSSDDMIAAYRSVYEKVLTSPR